MVGDEYKVEYINKSLFSNPTVEMTSTTFSAGKILKKHNSIV